MLFMRWMDSSYNRAYRFFASFGFCRLIEVRIIDLKNVGYMNQNMF